MAVEPAQIVAPDHVSRARYDRERKSRQQAEDLLENKSRALFEANTTLLAETDALRSALVALDGLRAREAETLRETTSLFRTLDAISATTDLSEAVQAMLSEVHRAMTADATLLIHADTGHGLLVDHATDARLLGVTWNIGADLLSMPRRFANLHRRNWHLPARLNLFRSVLLVPLVLRGERPMALACLAEKSAGFSQADLALLTRISKVAGQALDAARQARRNAVMAALIDGRTDVDQRPEAGIDAPFLAVNRAFDRLTQAQGQVVEIVNRLLRAPVEATDAAIATALADMGALSGADRVYVFRLHGEAFIGNTHEWTAPGIRPVISDLQDIPADTIAHWRTAFDQGGDILIADVAALPDDAPVKPSLMQQGVRSLLAVPLLIEGRFAGFVGYDSVRVQRSFLPGEVHLIRSVANVIAVVLQRRDSEAGIAAANKALVAQRNRLQATLGAMPDLLLEIDAAGRFRDFHSGAIQIPDAVHLAFRDNLLEDVLPPALAAEGRRVMRELSQTGKADGFVFPFDFGAGPVSLQLTAARMGDDGYLFVLRDITESRRQQALIERLGEVARRTTNLVIVTDAHRRIEWVNAAFEARTGYTLAEVAGQNPGGLLQTPRTDPATIGMMRTALDAGNAVQVEVLNQTRTGEEYWLSVDIQPLHDAEGALRGFMAVESDVTERRRQADALRETTRDAIAARQSLTAAVEALQDAFVLFDADDQLVICNDRYRSVYAKSAAAIFPGATFESILRYGLGHGEYAAAIGRETEWLAERLAHHRAEYSEVEQELSDGRWLRIFEKATPDGGRVGLRVDITALKAAERRALDDRAEAMEASSDGIALTDASGKFVYMNATHRKMFAIMPEADVNDLNWSDIYSLDNARWLEQNAVPVLFQAGSWRGEIEGRALDGSLVEQEVSLTLKSDHGILYISRDISQRRRESRERARLRDDLQMAQRREVIGQMAAGLAHDFNNLLAAISGSAWLIEADVGSGSASQASAARIQAACAQAAALVQKLLKLGSKQTEKTRIDLRDPVREAAELVRAGLRAPGQLVLDLPPQDCTAFTDPTDVLQVVLNLAINARDALGAGANTVTIALRPAKAADLAATFAVGAVDPRRSYLCLVVSDTGPGMGPETAAQVFKPYFSTKGDRGTGLGLAIVSSVIAASGGAVRLETALGNGARFTVLWPVEPQSGLPAQPADPDLPELLDGRLDGRSILVVDDQDDVLEILTAFLEQAGAEVAPANDPRDALEAVSDDPDAWDLLITDFDMPEMDGAELGKAVRARAPDLPVLLVTALPGWQGRNETDGAPFAAVLGKPVTREALVKAAETAIAFAKRQKG